MLNCVQNAVSPMSVLSRWNLLLEYEKTTHPIRLEKMKMRVLQMGEGKGKHTGKKTRMRSRRKRGDSGTGDNVN